MDKLTQLAIQFGTDKWGKHNYTPIYYDLFKDRQASVLKVLEIGPAEGAGMFMFRDFFYNATIYGAEIDQNRVKLLQNRPHLRVFKCDQSSELDLISLLNTIGYDLDLVIDDGSHKPEDQISTFNLIFPKLVKGSTYIIEDVADENIIKELKVLENSQIKMMKLSNRYDDRLVIAIR